jgi:hypothetical protein
MDPIDPQPEPSSAAATEARRDLIELALRRRPEMGPAEVRKVLGALGEPVDPATLAADLRARGIEVVYRADGTEVLHATRPADDSVLAAPVARGGGPRAPWSAAGTGAAPLAHPGVIAAVALGIVLLIVSVALVLAGDGDDEVTPGTAPLTQAGPTTTTAPVRVAPTGPGADPALADGGDATDDFTRIGDGLGELDGVGPWAIGRGAWATADGAAVLGQADAAGSSVAWFDAGTPDLRAEVTLPELVSGAGLAFRVVDADDLWMWVVSPDLATVGLVRVEGGVATAVANAGIVVQEPGMTIGVHLAGPTIELLANGVVVLTATDDSPATGTGLGLGALPDIAPARFDDLTFRRGA